MGITNFFSTPGNYVVVALCLVVTIQLCYYLFLFSKLAFYKPKTRVRSQTYPVSVIICAKDEADHLARYLPGALLQKYATTNEIIVVDDNSEDDTKYVLQEFQKTFKHLRTLRLQQKPQFIPGKKYPLSMGIRTAAYEILLLTDADCLPATDRWIEKMQEKYADGIDIVLGYSPFERKKGLLNQFVRWEGFHTAIQYFSYAEKGIPYMGVGRNLSYRKELFMKNKGFSSINQIPGGDDDLFISQIATPVNVAISVDPETYVITQPPQNWSQWKKQKRRHYTTSKYYRPLHKFLLGVYAFTSFLFYPLLIATILTFGWVTGLIAYLVKMGVQCFIIWRCGKNLNEKDLAIRTPLFDIWMFFYYLLFAFAPLRKPDKDWR